MQHGLTGGPVHGAWRAWLLSLFTCQADRRPGGAVLSAPSQAAWSTLTGQARSCCSPAIPLAGGGKAALEAGPKNPHPNLRQGSAAAEVAKLRGSNGSEAGCACA
jgi:hypothetical protein